LFRVPTHIGRHLSEGHTLLVPTRQRMRAVQLAYAAERLGSGASVWASPDVLTPQGWARRECLAMAAAAPAGWPRILGGAEEWVLWRQAADAAARELAFLEQGTLAESLRQASELADEYGIVPLRGRLDSEGGLLCEARRVFEARCRELHAAPVSALLPRLKDGAGRALLLRGFDAVPPRLAALATARAAAAEVVLPPQSQGRAVRTADAQAEHEAIALWCRERLLAHPDARLLVIVPGPAGSRERLAALIRGLLDPEAALAAAGAARALVGIEGGEPFATLPLPAHALHGLALLAGAELDFEALSAWLTGPFWIHPAATQRAHLVLALRQRGFARLGLRELLGALQLAPRELRPAARELDALLRRAGAALGEGSASPRRWSERFEAALAALTWPGTLAPGSALQQTRLRWRELLDEFGELAPSVGTLSRGAALELVGAFARYTAYRPADDDVPVTVSPMLADPVVHYDGIWVAALSADVLPQPAAPNPFLPLQAQADAGVPAATAAGRRRQAEALRDPGARAVGGRT
jgi:ATP-dependent helicase/nuclease subunit B